MNIICNDCIGARLYNEYKEEYKNPFIWNCITTTDFVYLMNNYDTINFNNFKVMYSNDSFNDNFNYPLIRIDDKININFVHYYNDKTKDKPFKAKLPYEVNLFYKDIISYTYDKYNARKQRMNEKPMFIYSTAVPKFNNETIEYVIRNKPYGVKLLVCDNSIELYNKNETDELKFYKFHCENGQKWEYTWNSAKNIKNEFDNFIK